MEREVDPKRGCGQKQEDAFYAESILMPGGGLYAWTWILGDAVEGGDMLPIEFPARALELVDPAAILATGTLVKWGDGADFAPADEEEARLYSRFQTSTKTIGVGDHVGKDTYSAFSFAKEAIRYGASRRIPPQMAKTLAELIDKHGSLPMLFSHDRVPVFRSPAHVEEARSIVSSCVEADWSELNYNPTWDHADFGMYAAFGQYWGKDHWLIPILQALDAVTVGWDEEIWVTEGDDDEDFPGQVLVPRSSRVEWQMARAFFDDVPVREQIFGAGWLNAVSYTLPRDKTKQGEAAAKVKEAMPNINIIDLDSKTETISGQLE